MPRSPTSPAGCPERLAAAVPPRLTLVSPFALALAPWHLTLPLASSVLSFSLLTSSLSCPRPQIYLPFRIFCRTIKISKNQPPCFLAVSIWGRGASSRGTPTPPERERHLGSPEGLLIMAPLPSLAGIPPSLGPTSCPQGLVWTPDKQKEFQAGCEHGWNQGGHTPFSVASERGTQLLCASLGMKSRWPQGPLSGRRRCESPPAATHPSSVKQER